jgi:hypothetical protein
MDGTLYRRLIMNPLSKCLSSGKTYMLREIYERVYYMHIGVRALVGQTIWLVSYQPNIL